MLGEGDADDSNKLRRLQAFVLSGVVKSLCKVRIFVNLPITNNRPTATTQGLSWEHDDEE